MNIREKVFGVEEEVNGIIIGDVTVPYQFWTMDGSECIDRSYFRDDDTAIAWFKERYPDWYAVGIDMRVYDVRQHEAR